MRPLALALSLMLAAAAVPRAARAVPPDLGLEKALDARIKELRRTGKIGSDERTAWVVFDITTGHKLASINEDEPFEAASLIKPFLALAYFHQVKAGKLAYGPRERARMEAMIQRSDNAAADWVMRRLGGPAATERLLRRSYGGLLRDLRLVEYIPISGRTYRNRASAHDYSRFLYAAWTNELPNSAELRRLMHLPNRDRLYSGTSALPADAEIYDKTGSTSRLCGDMGVIAVKGPGGRMYPYIVVGLVEKKRPARRYFDWIYSRGDVIREISDLAYGVVARLHKLDQPELSASRDGR